MKFHLHSAGFLSCCKISAEVCVAALLRGLDMLQGHLLVAYEQPSSEDLRCGYLYAEQIPNSRDCTEICQSNGKVCAITLGPP